MKRLIILAAGLLLACNVFADNKADRMEKEIRILKQQVEALDNNNRSLDPIYTANAAEDKVNAFLTLSGYIEMSAGQSAKDDSRISSPDPSNADGKWMSVGIVEFVFDFDFSDQLKATIHVTSEADGGIDYNEDDNYTSSLGALVIEEANFTWVLSQLEGLSITVGIQDINPGLEASEAVDLYQYSVASYNDLSDTSAMPHYAQGITLTYDTEQFQISVGVYDNFDNMSNLVAWAEDNITPLSGISIPGTHDGNIDEFAYLIKGTFKINDDASISAAYGSQESDEEDSTNDSSLEYDFFNINGIYTISQFEFAAEYVQADVDFYGYGDIELTGYLLRGTYSINDKWSVSLRYDVTEVDYNSVLSNFVEDEEHEGFAISASVVVSDNLLVIFEFGKKEIEYDDAGDVDEDWFVVEAFITF